MSLYRGTRCLYISRSPPKTDRYLLQPATVYLVHITSPCIYYSCLNLKNILRGARRAAGVIYRWLCRARGVWRRGGSGEASVGWRLRGGAGPRPSRRRASPGRCRRVDNFGVQVGCPKTPVKGKMPSKGSRRVGPTEVPAMRYPHNHPPALANERNVDALPAMGEKKHRGNFTGCTRRPCLKRRLGSCPSSPARCRSSPRNVKFHQHRHLTRSTRPATYRELRPFRYAL